MTRSLRSSSTTHRSPTPGSCLSSPMLLRLLWRLQLLNVRVGERWQLLADRWQTQSLTGVRPFYVAHAMMALAAAGRAAAVQRVFNTLPQSDTHSALSSHPEDALMLPLCKALLAFAHND